MVRVHGMSGTVLLARHDRQRTVAGVRKQML
jgi:hypothetical protein